MQQLLAQHPISAPKLKRMRSKGYEQTPTDEQPIDSRPPAIPLRVSYDSAIGMKGTRSRGVSGGSKCEKEENDSSSRSSRGRWTISPDATLRALTPAMRSTSRGDYKGKRSMSKEKKHGVTGDVKGKKDSGLWAWATWF
ncbi:hypothetical protein TGAM01_v201774 [Trichoderma gamsii]|uniref:Uncharacterized protein n=1 Tax=Trichoderma gamsii TaxID=398673 RepID=A0A2P4ZZ02_9HYPO|nr:hypothetical protein TGAM01_v201774 [Trichoderma gamsii]PON29525.1 hypothetical protein TGAM01_v201774 [Trichoderma gamsii]